MTMYIQSNEIGQITDVISYSHEGYVATEVTLPLPTKILSGCYELRDGIVLYRKEWDINEDIVQLQEKIDQLTLLLAMQGGAVIG